MDDVSGVRGPAGVTPASMVPASAGVGMPPVSPARARSDARRSTGTMADHPIASRAALQDPWYGGLVLGVGLGAGIVAALELSATIGVAMLAGGVLLAALVVAAPRRRVSSRSSRGRSKRRPTPRPGPPSSSRVDLPEEPAESTRPAVVVQRRSTPPAMVASDEAPSAAVVTDELHSMATVAPVKPPRPVVAPARPSPPAEVAAEESPQPAEVAAEEWPRPAEVAPDEPSSTDAVAPAEPTSPSPSRRSAAPDAWSELQRATQLRDGDQLDEAEAIYRELLAGPDRVRGAASLGLGVLMVRRGRVEDAEPLLRQTIELDYRFADAARTWLGIIEHRRADTS